VGRLGRCLVEGGSFQSKQRLAIMDYLLQISACWSTAPHNYKLPICFESSEGSGHGQPSPMAVTGGVS
jgi:hypothetical protein